MLKQPRSPTFSPSQELGKLFVTATATPIPHFLRSIRDGLTGAAESLQG
jgi:hypothetical protein